MSLPSGTRSGKYPCGFCRTKDCKLCPETVKNASTSNPGNIWYCPCYVKDHALKGRIEDVIQIS